MAVVDSLKLKGLWARKDTVVMVRRDNNNTRSHGVKEAAQWCGMSISPPPAWFGLCVLADRYPAAKFNHKLGFPTRRPPVTMLGDVG